MRYNLIKAYLMRIFYKKVLMQRTTFYSKLHYKINIANYLF